MSDTIFIFVTLKNSLKITLHFAISILSLFAISCNSMSNDHSQLQTNETLVDKCANFQTVRLFEFLRDSPNKGILFGHQDDLAYGVNWQSESGRSDIKEVCGQYPAVFGWDIGGIGQD